VVNPTPGQQAGHLLNRAPRVGHESRRLQFESNEGV
jgi:hypothetical protein